MTKVILKTEKASDLFSLVFPANLPMNYSEEKKSVEHPSIKGIWIKIKETEIKTTFETTI